MQLEFLVHHAKEAARVVRILSLLDPKTGKETKKSPRCLLAKQNAMIEVFDKINCHVSCLFLCISFSLVGGCMQYASAVHVKVENCLVKDNSFR